MENIYDLYFDGACNPNPNGEASFGFHLSLNKITVSSGYGIVGRGQGMTDVVAEYSGLLEGLHSFLRFWDKPNSVLNIYGDSKYVIKSIDKDIPFKLFDTLSREQIIVLMAIRNIRDMNVKVTLNWISREQNQITDSLAKNLRNKLA